MQPARVVKQTNKKNILVLVQGELEGRYSSAPDDTKMTEIHSHAPLVEVVRVGEDREGYAGAVRGW